MNVMIIMAIITSIVGFAVGLTPYILQSLGLYRLAKNRGIDAPWLAWIPVGKSYIMGSLSEASPYIKKKFPKMRIIFPSITGGYLFVVIILTVVMVTRYLISFPMWESDFMGFNFFGSYIIIFNIIIYVLGLAVTASGVFVMYHIYKVYDPANAVLYTVLSAIGLSFIFLFIIRNKQPVAEDRLIH